MYESAMYASAKASGVKASEADALHKTLVGAGMTSEGASKSLMFAMTGDLDISKMPQLAAMAKGMTAMNPEMTTSDALQTLIESISSGQVRGLRRAGVYGLDFNYAERKYAFAQNRSIDELLPSEQARIREDAVVAVSKKYADMGANLDPLQQSLKDLAVNTNEAKEAIGKGLLPLMAVIVEKANSMAKFIAEHPDVAKALGVVGVAGAGAAVGAGAGALIGGLGAIPGAAIGGTIGLGVGLYNPHGRNWWNWSWAAEVAASNTDVTTAKRQTPKEAAAKKAADEAAAAATKAQHDADEQANITARWDLKNQEEDRAAIRQSRRTAADMVNEASAKGLDGRKAVEAQYAARLKQLTTRVDSHGDLRTMEDEGGQIAKNVNAAMGTEIRNTRTKMVRDMEREITKEHANQFEGAERIDAATAERVDKLKEEGWLTDAQIKKLTDELGIEQKRTAVVEEQRKSREDLAQATISDLQGYKRISAELDHWVEVSKRLGTWTPEAEASRTAIAGVETGRLNTNFGREYADLQSETAKSGVNVETERLQQQEQSKLAVLETTYQFDLKAKLSVEKQKFDIEMTYVGLIAEKKKDLREIEYADDVRKLKAQLADGTKTDIQYDQTVRELDKRRSQDENHLDEVAGVQRTDLEKKHNADVRRMIQEDYVQLFDKLKNVGGGLFDALTDKSKTFAEQISAMFKKMVLDITRDIFASQFAKMLAGPLGGGAGNGGNGPGNGNGGGIGGILNNIRGGFRGLTQPNPNPPPPSDDNRSSLNPLGGHFPIMLDSDGQPALSASADGSWPGSYADLHSSSMEGGYSPVPGGYSPIPGGHSPIAAVAGAAVSPGMLKDLSSKIQGGLSGHGKWGGAVDSLMTMAGLSMAVNGLSQGNGVGGTINRAGGGAMAAYGIAGKQLGISGSAGVGLAYDGIVRGGGWGMLEAAGGGALIGAKFGGPLGAIIGAAAGAAAAGIRTLIGGKSKTQQAHDLILRLYGVDISDQKILKQIVDIAKKAYGDNLDMAVRSQEIRDLVKLYAQTMGQKTSLTDMAVHSASMIESGGKMYQGAVYDNGVAYSYGSPFSTLGGLSTEILPTSSPNGGINVTLNAQQTIDLWKTGTTSAMRNNPRLVASSALAGSQSSATRSGNAVNTLAPSVITH
jgi:hypothetical protein